MTLAVIAALALVTGGAVALATRGSSGRHTLAASHVPSIVVPTLPTPTPTPTTPSVGATNPSTPSTTLIGRTIIWEGMQISTVQGVGAVIQTVGLDSPGDVAGLEPGDVIQSIHNRAIETAAEIAPALRGLRRGAAVTVSVERGSTTFTTTVSFAALPTTSP